jgi:hypothetical protein
MSVVVTLNVYSGRPNPTWRLTTRDEEELAARMRSLTTLSSARPSGVMGGLGYRGFSLTRSHESPLGPLSAFVHERIVDGPAGTPNFVDDTGLERWLIESAPPDVDDALKRHVIDRMGAAQTSPVVTLNTAAAGCPTNQAADAPTYNPAPWNIPTVQPYNNCYNYANNNPTNTFAQPGRASGHPAATMACGDVQPAAIFDGLRAVANFSSPLATGNGWYVALVVWPGRDYHWYRQDTVGCWSHKPGQTAVRNVDNAGKAISDPKSCDRGPYTDFCSYMVTKRGIVIS